MKFLIVLSALLFLFMTARGDADCGSVSEPSYKDISAVKFERAGCGSFIHRPSDFSCSAFWFYVGPGPERGADLFWYEPAPKGYYSVAISLKAVRGLLEAGQFFKLNPREISVTDMKPATLTVKYCGVVKRILLFPRGQEGESRAMRLFASFDNLIMRSKWDLLGERPTGFPYSVFGGP